MTREEAIAQMKECGEEDIETGHIHADEVLCELLRSLGYSDVVDIYESLHRWFG